MKIFLTKMFFSVLGVLICGIPFWIYLSVRYFFSPHGFWQEIFLFGIGIYILGSAQVILLILLAIWLLLIWKGRK